jgi:hypothetical protein
VPCTEAGQIIDKKGLTSIELTIMTIKYSFKLLSNRPKEIYKQSGLTGLLKSGIRFLVSPVYKSESFWLTVINLTEGNDANKYYPRISLDKLMFKAISSNEEADKLEAEGYSFRNTPTYFNHNLTLYRQWLNYGAVACCIFIEKEFVAIDWAIISKYTQEKIGAPPVIVDYDNHEAFSRGAWVNPKYRGLKLWVFTAWHRNLFLAERYFTVKRGVVDYTNNPGKGISEASGHKVCGTGRRTRFLWRTTWKEQHFTKPVFWSEIGKVAVK